MATSDKRQEKSSQKLYIFCEQPTLYLIEKCKMVKNCANIMMHTNVKLALCSEKCPTIFRRFLFFSWEASFNFLLISVCGHTSGSCINEEKRVGDYFYDSPRFFL